MLPRFLITRWFLSNTSPDPHSTWLRCHKALTEAALVACFMVFLALMSVLLEYPGSALHQLLPWPWVRRALMGLCAGSSLACVIYSPWGQRTGAHINPAVTLAMALIRRIRLRTTLLYVTAQLMGAMGGMAIAELLLGRYLAHPQVDHIATAPGDAGLSWAFVGELSFSFALMTLILVLSSRPRWAPYTGLAVAITVAVFTATAAPLSGMSMNPARTLGSAIFSQDWHDLWIYFVAPPLGMLTAAGAYVRLRKLRRVRHLPGI
jgi:aquaporin Z